MSDSDTLALLIIGLCLIGSVFFSGSETAITSFGELRARKIKEEGGRDAVAVARWVDHPLFVLSTILLGNNLVNTLLTTMIAAMVAAHLSGGEWSGYSVPVAVAGSTVLVLIFGEIIPKALGKIYSRQVTIPVLWILEFLGRLAYPLTWSLTRVSQFIIGRANNKSGNRVTVDELSYLIKVGQREGSIPAGQAAMLQGIVRFEEKIVRDIMVPLDLVTAVDKSWELSRIKEIAKRTGHSRLPVYLGDLDATQGVLHIKDLVNVEFDGSHPQVLEKIIRPTVFVSESLLIYDLMLRLKETRVHLAIVVDDAGDTVGVVTLEDVLEQIVGPIFDESDRAPRHSPSERIGIYYLGGQDSLSRIEEHFQCELEQIDGVDSVGDLLTRLSGQIPIAGSIFVWEGIRIKVLSADPKRIVRVSVERVEPEEPED